MSMESYILGFVKVAQSIVNNASPFAPNVSQKPIHADVDPVDQATNSLSLAYGTRGALKGAREILPQFAEGLTGLINGADFWIRGKGFNNGYQGGVATTRKYVGDPFRKLTMLLGGNEIRNAIDDEISRDDDRLRGEVDKKFKTHEVSDKYPRYNITKPNGEVSQIHFNNTSVPGSDAWHVYKDSLGRAKSWNDIVEPLVSVGGSLAIGGAGTVGALSKVDKLSKAKRIMDYMNMFGNALAPVSASYGRYVDNNIERNKDKYMQAADYVVGHKGVFPDQVAIDNLEKAVKYGDEYYQ